jgi:hypothetical protein
MKTDNTEIERVAARIFSGIRSMTWIDLLEHGAWSKKVVDLCDEVILRERSWVRPFRKRSYHIAIAPADRIVANVVRMPKNA